MQNNDKKQRFLPFPPALKLPAFGACAGFALGCVFERLFGIAPLLCAPLLWGLAVGVVFIPRSIPRLLFAFILGILSLHSAETARNHASASAAALASSSVFVSGSLAAVPIPTRTGLRFLCSVDSCPSAPALRGKLILCSSTANIPAYGKLRFSCTLRPLRGPDTPDAFNERDWGENTGFVARGSLDSLYAVDTTGRAERFCSALRNAVSRTIAHCGSFESRALLSATMLNESADLPQRTRELFRSSGLYHLLAISGYHVVVLAGSIALLAAALRLPAFLRCLLPALAAWLYLLFIGAIPSLFRAVIMSSLIFARPLIARRTDPLNALGAAGFIMLMLSPASLFSAGFLLSFSATLGIMLIHPAVSALWNDPPPERSLTWLRNFLLDAFSVSFAAFLATLPILMTLFGAIPWYGLFANIPCVPLMGYGMNSFLAALLAGGLHPLIVQLLGQLCEGLMKTLVFLARCPFGSGLIHTGQPTTIIIFLVALPLFSLLFCLPLHRLKVLLLSLCLSAILIPCILLSSADPETVLVAFHNKSGQLISCKSPYGLTLLVSPDKAGSEPLEKAFEGYICRRAKSSIDLLILIDGDNAPQSLLPFLSNYRVKQVILSGPPKEELSYENSLQLCREFGVPLTLAEGDSISLVKGDERILLDSKTGNSTFSFGRTGIVVSDSASLVIPEGYRSRSFNMPDSGSVLIRFSEHRELEVLSFRDGRETQMHLH